MPKTFISKVTASSSSSLSFTSGIDSTYDVYEFHFINLRPGTDNVQFGWQVNADGQTGFNELMLHTFVNAYNEESTGSSYTVGYSTSNDHHHTTDYSTIAYGVGSDADQSLSGIFTLYAPSSTTYVKQFHTLLNEAHYLNYTVNPFTGGYINTTSAIDEIDFKFSSGNIDSGTIKMYGVS